MPIHVLKNTVGLIMIPSHLAAILYCIIALSPRYGDTLELILILSPVFSLYTLIIFRDFAKEAIQPAGAVTNANPEHVTTIFSALSISIVVVFCGSIFVVMFLYVNQVIETEPLLRKWLSGIEVLLGAYLGVIMETLFPAGRQRSDTKRPRGRTVRQKP
jgi:hypothetical protein